MPSSTNPPSSFLPTHALDQAAAGIAAGLVSTVCMQPLDLLKVQLQVSTAPKGARGTLGQIAWGLREITRKEGGVKGLYRGIAPNLVGNASSWGFYFLWYTMLKESLFPNQPEGKKLNAGQHLLASATSGVITAVMTNPLWVVKTRMYTTSASSQHAYRGVLHGLTTLARTEGLAGLSKGLTLAIIGVSNGAIQFMVYEELKKRRFEAKKRRLGGVGDQKALGTLSNTEYIIMSGSAKLVAIGITYPYQVIRSRIQYQPQFSQPVLSSAASSSTSSPAAPLLGSSSPTKPLPPSSSSTPSIAPYRSIPDVLRRTYAQEGLGGFYKGLATNAVRILPGTCVTFVVYERVAGWLAKLGERRAVERRRGRGEMAEGG
ncbi:hypothetical protein JCM11251_000659 [Rhodosporidiobolus azoricus]